MIEVLDIGDRVETGSYRLHSRFRGALAFVRNPSASLVSVVDETKSRGPVHIMVRGLDFSHADSLAVAPHAVYLDGAAVPIGPRSDSSLHPLDLNLTRLNRNLGVLRETLLEACGGPTRGAAFLLDESWDSAASAFDRAFAVRFRSGVERLVAGDLEGAALIRGLGPGLTPSGDDFLAGFLLGLNALEAAGAAHVASERQSISQVAMSRNPFSAALLNCAAEGRSIEPARSLIHSLFENSEPAVIRHTRRLAAVGASSGADLATGLYCALKSRPGAKEGAQA